MYLAGRPGELRDALTDAGVTDFLYEGCDVLAALRHVHDVLDLG
ncbi:hypothetical protein [Breoghania sp. L-A4]|nr:hypothetical protein [Breoghania sp. L-A4]